MATGRADDLWARRDEGQELIRSFFNIELCLWVSAKVQRRAQHAGGARQGCHGESLGGGSGRVSEGSSRAICARECRELLLEWELVVRGRDGEVFQKGVLPLHNQAEVDLHRPRGPHAHQRDRAGAEGRAAPLTLGNLFSRLCLSRRRLHECCTTSRRGSKATIFLASSCAGNTAGSQHGGGPSAHAESSPRATPHEGLEGWRAHILLPSAVFFAAARQAPAPDQAFP